MGTDRTPYARPRKGGCAGRYSRKTARHSRRRKLLARSAQQNTARRKSRHRKVHAFARPPTAAALRGWRRARQNQKYVIQQFAKCLPNDHAARKSFVQSGALQKIQELRQFYSEQQPQQNEENTETEEDQENDAAAENHADCLQYIATINDCFPPELVQYYSPNYSTQLLEKLDQYDAQP